MEPQQKISVGPKEFFLHIGALITLVASVASIITILFTVIEIILPDVLNTYYGYQFSGTRFALATLITVFPAYYYIARYLRQEREAHPEVSLAWVRKWLTGFIVFVTGAVVLGDVVSLLYGFVNGELTSRFALKSFAVLLVVVVPFLYYFFEAKIDMPRSRKIISIIAYVSPVIVLGSIILGFAYTGLPGTARDLRLDGEKVNDLQSIQWRITDFYTNKGSVPTNLAEVTDNLNGGINFKDRETGEPYAYVKTGDKAFKLCAVFHRVTDKDASYPITNTNDTWTHGAGEYCFDRTINTALYPVTPVMKVQSVQ
jgi:hypothetical protein